MTHQQHPNPLNHPNYPADDPGPVSVAEEALDRELDALARGDRRALDRLRRHDPVLAGAVSEVYALADLSGFADGPSSPMLRTTERRRFGRPSMTRRRLMTGVATVAATVAVAVGLAMAIPALVPDRERETATLAALDAPPVLDGATEEPAASGVGVSEPGSVLGEVTRLSPNDCTVAPRSRQEVLEILSVAPAEGNRVFATERPIDNETRNDLMETLRGWQSCTAFGLTWHAMSLETEQFIREDIYGNPEIPVAYSAPTLNEILDAREALDAERAERLADPAVAAGEYVAVMDPTGRNEITWDDVPTETARMDLILASPSMGEWFRAGPAFFEREGGEWRIRSIDLDVRRADAVGPAADVGWAVVSDVDLSAPGISWSVNELTVAQGDVIGLTNDGSGGQHSFVIEGYNDDAPADMPVGRTVVWTVPPDLAPGTYTFYCAIPGHRALMEGTITITEA